MNTNLKSGQQKASGFSRSANALEADGFGASLLVFILVASILTAWLVWFFRSSITLYEIADKARLEIIGASHPVQASVAGRIVSHRLALGRDVRAGDILVEIESVAQELEREEELARRDAFGPKLGALREEIAAEEEALELERQATHAAQDETRARLREAEIEARFARLEAERLQRLHAEGLMAEVDLLRAGSEAERRQAAVDAILLAVQKLAQEQRTREGDRKTRLERLKHQATEIKGQIATTTAAIHRVEQEIERRRVRAPVSGRLGEVAELRIGAVVAEGARLATIVPDGHLKLIADFNPPAALGRIRPGQSARLRLHGFPWSQYGSISAEVAGVSSEVREGMVRVELNLQPMHNSPIPLQHGLPGTVEVEVERISPIALVLRAAGTMITRPSAAANSPIPAGGSK